MKKLLSLCLSIFVLGLIFFPLSLKAQVYQSEQYYSVTFDNEQEAAVSAKISLFNRGKEGIKNINLEIPGQDIRLISAIQEKANQENYCREYDYSAPLNKNNSERPCLSWGKQPGVNTYVLLEYDETKIEKLEKSIKIEIPLKEEIASQSVGSIILYYKANGFVKKVWNGYKYAFETIKTPYDFERVRVAIDVADELYIKESAEGTTNFQTDTLEKAVMPLSSVSFAPSGALSNFSQSISSRSGVVKTTSSLDPNENYKVEGKYYESSFWGELPVIGGIVLTFLVIMGVLIFIVRNEKK